MVKWDGSEQLQLTSSPDSESSPRWSPDSKVPGVRGVARHRGREEAGGQIWLLNRAGGEAQKVSDFKGGVTDIQWSPDSTRIAFVAERSGSRRRAGEEGGLEAQDRAADRDRSLSLQAGSRRLPQALYNHIAVFDHRDQGRERDHEGQRRRCEPVVVARRQADRVPEQARPSGSRSHVERGSVGRRGARRREPRQITKTPEGEGGRPAWSPDGTASRCSIGDIDRFGAYAMNKLIVVPSNPPRPRDRRPSRRSTCRRSIARCRTSQWSPTGRASRSCCRTIARSTSRQRAGGESERHPAPHDRATRDLIAEPGQGRQLRGADDADRRA